LELKQREQGLALADHCASQRKRELAPPIQRATSPRTQSRRTAVEELAQFLEARHSRRITLDRRAARTAIARPKAAQHRQHIGRPSHILRTRERQLHRGHAKKLQPPPLGNWRCVTRTSRRRTSSPLPKVMRTDFVCRFTTPIALSLEMLGDASKSV
jgi:hypothetical protein